MLNGKILPRHWHFALKTDLSSITNKLEQYVLH
ncbi:hypothetical protein PST407_04060 [Pseudomonas syringae pv. tomato]|uniref:Transposase n=1 Tax=Pseudomonas syringae pv. tomato TaxID=323 RepID=A0AAV1BRE5_PSEUB|nr:hypothetical protein PST407_04060 [Pseudomonas syringae pv. tomato]KUR48295.1 hypothetical protein PSTA9_01065 [Pseudomonas syringae pv. tomato]CAI8910351.1 hypothetical protein DAPPPG215_18515 [Pseudomonas syringae pv. tomato]